MQQTHLFSPDEIAKKWHVHYSTAPFQLAKMADVKGLISAFNANIDAVKKVSGAGIEELVKEYQLDGEGLIREGERQIRTISDAVRGIIHCFKSGIAEEWLVEEVSVYEWLNDEIGFDKLQMGGQGGIVANVMAVCGVNPVYVHCASLPSAQAGLFLDRDNLLTVDQYGEIAKANSVDRDMDIPLVHWIIEFDKGDSLNIGGQTFVCPKSNRFIATYDPLNFRLHIDEDFARVMSDLKVPPEIIILSGYQMLQQELDDGSPGSERIDSSIGEIEKWINRPGNQIVHLEMASTQDRSIRKYLLDTLAKRVDSLGFNERELIDLLEVIGEDQLAEKCEKETDSVNLFQAMLKLFDYAGAPRMQLHMFGLYMAIQSKDFHIPPESNREGMQLAAVIAATKAGTGALDSEEVLLWAKDKEVSDRGIQELIKLSEYIELKYGGNELISTGIWKNQEFDLIAVPTILIDKPITLVGMGDTISSISLVAAR